MAMGTVISVRAQGARAGYFQSRPLRNPPEIASQPVGGLDFYYTPSGRIIRSTPSSHRLSAIPLRNTTSTRRQSHD
jgi:hypothetical protein